MPYDSLGQYHERPEDAEEANSEQFAQRERELEQLSLWQQEEYSKPKNKSSMIKYTAVAVIKDEKQEEGWEERLEVGSRETAQADVQQIVDRFNSNRRSWETPRELVSIKSVIEEVVEDKNPDDLDTLFGLDEDEDEDEDEDDVW